MPQQKKEKQFRTRKGKQLVIKNKNKKFQSQRGKTASNLNLVYQQLKDQLSKVCSQYSEQIQQQQQKMKKLLTVTFCKLSANVQKYICQSSPYFTTVRSQCLSDRGQSLTEFSQLQSDPDFLPFLTAQLLLLLLLRVTIDTMSSGLSPLLSLLSYQESICTLRAFSLPRANKETESPSVH